MCWLNEMSNSSRQEVFKVTFYGKIKIESYEVEDKVEAISSKKATVFTSLSIQGTSDACLLRQGICTFDGEFLFGPLMVSS